MKNFKSRFIFAAIIAVLIVAIAYSFLEIQSNLRPKADLSSQGSDKKSEIDELLKNSSEIHRVWWEGEESKEWARYKLQCLKKWNVTEQFDETLIRCNPMFIECLSEIAKDKTFVLDGSPKLVSKLNSNIYDLKESAYLFSLKNQKNNRGINFLLKNFCHERYLDPAVYAYGEKTKREEDDYLFDTTNQNIYVDTHLVLNYEYNDFSRAIGEERKDIKGNELFLPVTNIKLEEMEKFCNFQGKELMSAEIFDAATFYNEAQEIKGRWRVNRGPFYWTNLKKTAIENCEQVFSKECLEKNKYRTNIISPTKGGIFDSMGGVMEAFRNPLEPDKNLKASSFYINRNSKWNRLGLRSHWTGEGNDLRHFFTRELELDSNIDEIKVGFRCMRRVD